jgi:hypothetical protein
MWRSILLDIPIFVAASLSSAVFYFCAQRTLYPNSWMKENLLFPLLLGLGIGLALNNARAVIEALFNHQSEFTRTPKYGIHGAARDQRKNIRYLPLKSLLPLLELGFALYFTYYLVLAVMHRQWFSLPFLLLFQGGFGYVAISSISQWLPRVSIQPRDPVDAVPA